VLKRIVMRVLWCVPDRRERLVAEEACGCREQEEFREGSLGDTSDLAATVPVRRSPS
jgi:hypothetical protein